MTIPEYQRRAVAKYKKEHYDSILLRLPKGYKSRLQEAAAKEGKSINAYLKSAIDAKLSKTKE